MRLRRGEESGFLTLYERWPWDIIDGQRPDGSGPNVTPGAYFDAYNCPWWGGCLVWIPWEWYPCYGDDSLLSSSYPAMKRYVHFLGRAADIPGEYAGRITADGFQDSGLADWCPIEETPRMLINTPTYYLYANVVSRTAKPLGQSEDAHRFLDPSTEIYGPRGSSAQNGFPIPPLDAKVPYDMVDGRSVMHPGRAGVAPGTGFGARGTSGRRRTGVRAEPEHRPNGTARRLNAALSIVRTDP